MASYGEKAQKLTGEAFARICSDHELFLEAYESKSKTLGCVPSELASHWASSFPLLPPFLRRTEGVVVHGSPHVVSARDGHLGGESGEGVGEARVLKSRELLARRCCRASRRGQLYMFSRVR